MTRQISTFQKSVFFRVPVFLAGALLLILPSMVILQAIRETEKRSFNQRREETREKNQTMLELMRKHEFANVQLEEKLHYACEKISGILFPGAEYSRPSSEKIERAIQEAVTPLFQENPEIGIMFLWNDFDSRKNTGKISFPYQSGFFTKDIEFFRQFLNCLVLRMYEGDDYEKWKLLDSRFPFFLGRSNDFTHFFIECRKTLSPVVIRKKTYFLYWQPMFKPEYSKLILESDIPEKEKWEPDAQGTLFSRQAIGKVVYGGILILVPRTLVREDKAEYLIKNFSKPDSILSLVSSVSKKEYINSGISPGSFADLIKASRDLSEPEWVVSSEPLELEEPHTITIATRIPRAERTFSRWHSIMIICTILFLFVGITVWFFSVFFEVGITSFLSFQLGWGFLLAALLPLSATIFISELLSEERLESLLKQDRVELRQRLDQLEYQYGFHHHLNWSGIKNYLRGPGLGNLLKEIKNHAKIPEAEKQSIKNKLSELFFEIRNPPLKISLRSVTLVGPEKFYVNLVERVASGGGDLLPKMFAEFGANTLNLLNPGKKAGDRPETETIGDLKKGTILEFALRNLLSIFGPDTYYQLLFDTKNPMVLAFGSGDWTVLPTTVPSDSDPKYLATSIFLAKHTDRDALNRILAYQEGSQKIFAVTADLIGLPIVPETGEAIPFLRSIARQVKLTGDRASMKMESGGEIFQIETSPLVSSRQFIFIGVSPESPIKEKIMDLRKTLLFFVFAAFAFTFLLSFSATNYLLSPIETLTLGMNSINSGNFRHRIPVDRSDELGDVFNAFNTMARGLEEGELMELMVSDSAREAMESEETEAIAKTGKRLDATILFIGIPEFEKSLMQENPRILMEKMSLQVGCICRVILGFDGMVDKLIGDKILAYFRHDQNGESQAAEAAVNSLHEIMQTYYDGGIPFRIASGITSGKVILGLLGAGERIDHTIIGDPVNLAARAEAVAETLPDNQIVISQEALLNFQGDANIIPLDISNVKGKKAIVSLSQIILEYKINSGENHG